MKIRTNAENFAIQLCEHTSILVASPPFTIGTVLPAWIRYWPMEWPFRLRIGLTERRRGGRGRKTCKTFALMQHTSFNSVPKVQKRCSPYLGMFSHLTPPHMTPSLPVWTLQHHRDARQCLHTEKTHTVTLQSAFTHNQVLLYGLQFMLHSVQQGCPVL